MQFVTSSISLLNDLLEQHMVVHLSETLKFHTAGCAFK